MSRMRACVIVALLMAGLSAAVLSEVNMREGNWEMTVKAELKGVFFKMPAVKYAVCLTRGSMNPKRYDEKCRILSSKLQGSTYNWVAECTTDDGIMRSDGSITYRGETLDGYINVVSGGMQMRQRMTGRWIGPCADRGAAE
ncbi:MAG: DUF3617 family protein [Spirochaetes bacterium]|nr:DUF3617 family protein [Spirochaetota bacterium]